MNTRTSLSIALEEAKEVLRLSPRYHDLDLGGVSIILVLLGELQDAYDFIKSCPDYGSRGPFVAVHGGDITEPIDEAARQRSTSVRAALTFVKIEAASQIKDAIHARMLVERKTLPATVGSDISQFLSSPLPPRSRSELKDLHERLMQQAVDAFAWSTRGDWRAILTDERPVRGKKKRPTLVAHWLQAWFPSVVKLWRRHAWFLREQLKHAS